ncbi:enoyl-CoA hydratase/isomerase family protein [Tropicibacter sp. R16_0]|uniref:enoyl-CoA hydratase/isomerase family protein n=1 Tax=Tropicibacter sp. R16_0 TaxID=2821102 RepID=UPI001ADB624C|nr:enoyl-CoA hydratase/isomerase family protein [Tropicibacter sp. R16_0]MBO9452216.1 enoyl-CoA hydratase/isomerase family protein [Tropicibacter sp. R16_0]
MSADSLILTQRDGACLTVTVNRPDKANSLTTEMLVLLRDIFRKAATDDDLRAIIMTGAGDRVFCAGADLNTLYDAQNGPDPWDEMAEALRAVPILTVAAINGPCIGGGMTLALGCDIRICVPEARFGYPVLKNNVLPGQYDVDTLQALIGPGRSAAILLGGDTVSAEDAAAWGLIDRLTPPEALQDTCRSLCATALAAEGAHLKTLKSMLRRA